MMKTGTRKCIIGSIRKDSLTDLALNHSNPVQTSTAVSIIYILILSSHLPRGPPTFNFRMCVLLCPDAIRPKITIPNFNTLINNIC